MQKIKIPPINLERAKNIKGVSKNIFDVVDFQVSLATELNRIASEINDVMPDTLDNQGKADSKEVAALKSEIEKLVKAVKSKPNNSDLDKLKGSIESKIPAAYDDSSLVKLIKKIDSKVIPAAYDDSGVIKLIKSVESKIKPQYDDAKIIDLIDNLEGKVAHLTAEIEELKLQSESIKKEISSNRKEAGFKIDVIEQKLNKITEIEEWLALI